jgi:hypothetical protein
MASKKATKKLKTGKKIVAGMGALERKNPRAADGVRLEPGKPPVVGKQAIGADNDKGLAPYPGRSASCAAVCRRKRKSKLGFLSLMIPMARALNFSAKTKTSRLNLRDSCVIFRGSWSLT